MKPLLYLGCPSADRPDVDVLLRSTGFAVRWVDNAGQALAALDERMAPVLVDLKSAHAIRAAVELRTRRPATSVVAVADPDRPLVAERARKMGVTRLLQRPLAPQQLLDVVAAGNGNGNGNGVSYDDRGGLDGIVADSPQMKELIRLVRRAGSNPNGGVLLSGEAGTGRRYVARALHDLSCPPGGRLVEVDCAASDLETSLFGAKPNEDARKPAPPISLAGQSERITRTSLLYQAFGGSLLLQNLADMPARVQARLARLLRDGEASVGASASVRGAIRPMACVEPGFESAVDEGRVRPDLYKRLAVNRIDIPALRDRRDDIPALMRRFVEEICQLAQVPIKEMSHPAQTLLTSLPYRGNVRELKALVATLIERTPSAVVRLEDVLGNLRLDVGAAGWHGAGTLREARSRFEQQYISEVLDRHHGRIAEAARTLGIQRTNLYRKMRTLGVVRHRHRPPAGGDEIA